MEAERRPVRDGSMLIYTVGRSYLLESFHSFALANQVVMPRNPMTRRAYEQLNKLEVEYRDTGVVYTCPSGEHDDLAISCAMLVWAARHPHLNHWYGNMIASRRPPRRRDQFGWGAFV